MFTCVGAKRTSTRLDVWNISCVGYYCIIEIIKRYEDFRVDTNTNTIRVEDFFYIYVLSCMGFINYIIRDHLLYVCPNL